MKTKKVFGLICLFFITTLAPSCKKDESSGGGGVITTITPTPAPAGFTFPRIYYQTIQGLDFKVWIHSTDVTSQHKPEDFFTQPAVPQFNVTLLDQRTLRFTVSKGPTPAESNAGYFFYHDSLFVVTGDPNPLLDTVAFAKGDYTSFHVPFCNYLLSGKDNFHNTSRSSGTLNFHMTLQILSDYARDEGIADPDTAAYYNTMVTFN